MVPELEYGHARDVYAFGVLAESLLEKMTDLGMVIYQKLNVVFSFQFVLCHK